MNKNTFWKWLLLVGLTAWSMALVYPIKEKVKLGLDLQGGTMFVLEVKDADLDADAKKDAPERALEVLRNRVDGMGIAEPILYMEPNGRIIVQLPGLKAEDRTDAMRQIQSAAFLEFRVVHAQSGQLGDALITAGKAPTGYKIAEVEHVDSASGQIRAEMVYVKDGANVTFSPEEIDARKAAMRTFNAPANYDFMLMEDEVAGQTIYRPVFVFSRAELTGDELAYAQPDFGQYGDPTVSLKFSPEGAKRFAKVTGDYAPGGAKNPDQNVHRQLAIILDGKLYSAPRINEAIMGGSAVISGNFTIKEVNELSTILRAGALPAPVQVVEERGVDPTLGQDSINKGSQAVILGGVAVLIFMLGYYLLAGVVANVALIMDLLLLPLGMVIVSGFLGVFIGSAGGSSGGLPVLTLPGIAGIVLTIGMAVDANVLIFERIREELAIGKSIKGAITAGYQKAFSTILDANITTLLTAIILFTQGSGPIRGFAVTLSAGIVVSMFVALFATRLFFDTLTSGTKQISLKMFQFFKAPNIDFVGFRKYAGMLSLGIIILTWAVFIGRGEKNFGVDFTGGSTITYTFNDNNKQETDAIHNVLDTAGIKGRMVQYQGDQLVVTLRNEAAGDVAHDAITKAFGDYKEQSRGTVSAQVGNELTGKAIKAIILALIGIIIYVTIRFEFAFAMGAIVALVHDVLITVGVFCLLGNQLSLPIIAALLTIVGYSVNDTIVVFDRIREDLKLVKDKSYMEIANLSINQTLSRTVLTSVTTLLTVTILLIFGGGAIYDFALALFIGIVVGTYSSIFVATPIVLLWHRADKKQS
jgi:SecD/SecF fusion protein